MDYGQDLSTIRCEVQTRGLRGREVGSDDSQGSLSGASAPLPNSYRLAQKIRARATIGKSHGQRESSRERECKALQKDRSDGSGDRSVKKIPRDATTTEKRRYVRDHWKEFGSVSKACRQVGISSSSYYYSPKVDPVERANRDSDLRDLIEEIQEHYPAYGVRRVYWEFFWEYGKRINRKRIARVMKKYGLKALIYKGFKISTTNSKHNHRVYPNLVSGKEITAPNHIWAADITYVRIKTGFVFLAAILDLFSRRVIGWAISKKINTALCLEALKMAIDARTCERGCIHHSDRGVQYASGDYVNLLKEHGFEISMSRKGNCWDNAFVESFFGTLKREEIHLCEYEDIYDVINRLPQFIEDLYNKKRRHSSLGGLSPVEFEAKWKSGELEKLGIPSKNILWDGLSN